MENDRNLLFAVLALEAGALTAGQFVAGCQRWSQQPEQSLAAVLIDLAGIGPEQQARVQLLVQARLQHAEEAHGPASPPTRHDLPRASPVQALPRSLAETIGPPLTEDQKSARRRGQPEGQRYTRHQVHATGGMGRIWLAHDAQMNRHVALKELRPEVAGDAPLTSRFVQEARITGQLEHPGIVPVYEFAWHAETEQPYYTMRFVRGRTLVAASKAFHEKRRANAAEPLELVSLLSAFVAVCNTIAYAHSHRILHRDLKGENVLLGDFGEVVVLDWGLAKSLDAPEPAAPETEAVCLDRLLTESGKTVQGTVLGTPGYMSPEQAAGQLELIDQRTDVYGLGAILYEILTGQPPNAGSTTLEVLNHAQSGELMPPRDLWPEVPLALEAACLRALAKNPVFRFAAATDLAQEVQQWQEVQRRAAEDALQRQTEILQSILNSMGEGVLVADEDGHLLQVNPAAERIFGPQQLGAKFGEIAPGYEICLPDGVTACPCEQRPLSQALSGSEVDDVELYVRVPGKPDGLWASVSARPLRDKRGMVQGGVAVVRDISERKRAEEELRRSRERFDLAVQGSQDGLWDWDLETNDIYYSPRWLSIIGYDEHELAPRLETWEMRLHPEERERVLAANYAHIAGATPHYEYEYRLRHKDGTYRWILARGVALRDATGKAYRMAGSHVDVTNRRASEQALKDSEQRHDAVINALQVGVTVIAADGRHLASNPSAQRILDCRRADLEQRSLFDPCWQAIHEDGSPLALESFPAVRSLRTGKPCSNAVLGLHTTEGTVRWLSINSQPLFRNQETAPYAVVASFQDITAVKRLEAALAEAQTALRHCQENSAAQRAGCSARS